MAFGFLDSAEYLKKGKRRFEPPLSLAGTRFLNLVWTISTTLRTGMNAWVLEKKKPLGQVLLDQQALRPDAHLLLEALAQKHLELHGAPKWTWLQLTGLRGPIFSLRRGREATRPG
jgi:hypothetical protein